MSSAELKYPFVNIPPIVLNKKEGETLAVATSPSPDLEAYTELSSTPVFSPQTRNYISFLPKPTSRELEVVDGDVQYPQRHLLSQTEFVSPTVRTIKRKSADSALSPQTDKQTQKKNQKRETTTTSSYTEITKYDEEAMKYYIAGLSVVGLLIFYRFITRTKY